MLLAGAVFMESFSAPLNFKKAFFSLGEAFSLVDLKLPSAKSHQLK